MAPTQCHEAPSPGISFTLSSSSRVHEGPCACFCTAGGGLSVEESCARPGSAGQRRGSQPAAQTEERPSEDNRQVFFWSLSPKVESLGPEAKLICTKKGQLARHLLGPRAGSSCQQSKTSPVNCGSRKVFTRNVSKHSANWKRRTPHFFWWVLVFRKGHLRELGFCSTVDSFELDIARPECSSAVQAPRVKALGSIPALQRKQKQIKIKISHLTPKPVLSVSRPLFSAALRWTELSGEATGQQWSRRKSRDVGSPGGLCKPAAGTLELWCLS